MKSWSQTLLQPRLTEAVDDWEMERTECCQKPEYYSKDF